MTKVHKIAEAAMVPAETVHQAWAVTAPYGTPRKATLQPIFWAHVARKLRPLARVSVLSEDGSWFQELLCLVADGFDIRMAELNYWQLEDTSDVSDRSDVMRVEWAGPHHQFRVVRNADGVVLEKNFRSRSEAARWIAANVRVAA